MKTIMVVFVFFLVAQEIGWAHSEFYAVVNIIPLGYPYHPVLFPTL